MLRHAAPGERSRAANRHYVATLLTRHSRRLISVRPMCLWRHRQVSTSHNRSMGDLEVGYFVTPALRAFGIANAQYTHGGIDLPVVGLPGLPAAQRPVHDQIDRSHHLNLGVGASFSLTDSMDVFGSFVRTVAGRNDILETVDRGGALGFGGDGLSARTAETPPCRRGSSLVRCICQKSGS